MPEDKMQLQRWELKYVIPEETALLVREFVRCYLELDEYGAAQPNFSYVIHNLYLDSDDLKIYWGTINGDKNRYKLRLRFYEDNPNAPIFFEIKRRMNDSILKQRGGVKRFAVESILHGHHPSPGQLVSGDPRQLVAIQRFVQLMIADQATPRAHVSYLREAWISPTDNSVRVTLDRRVDIEPDFTTRFRAAFDKPTRVYGDLAILELKFSGRFPGWFSEMVRALGLRQGSASKYADGVANRGEAEFYTVGTRPPDPLNSAAASELKRERIDRIQNILHRSVPV